MCTYLFQSYLDCLDINAKTSMSQTTPLHLATLYVLCMVILHLHWSIISLNMVLTSMLKTSKMDIVKYLVNHEADIDAKADGQFILLTCLFCSGILQITKWTTISGLHSTWLQDLGV